MTSTGGWCAAPPSAFWACRWVSGVRRTCIEPFAGPTSALSPLSREQHFCSAPKSQRSSSRMEPFPLPLRCDSPPEAPRTRSEARSIPRPDHYPVAFIAEGWPDMRSCVLRLVSLSQVATFAAPPSRPSLRLEHLNAPQAPMNSTPRRSVHPHSPGVSENRMAPTLFRASIGVGCSGEGSQDTGPRSQVSDDEKPRLLTGRSLIGVRRHRR